MRVDRFLIAGHRGAAKRSNMGEFLSSWPARAGADDGSAGSWPDAGWPGYRGLPGTSGLRPAAGPVVPPCSPTRLTATHAGPHDGHMTALRSAAWQRMVRVAGPG